MSRVKVWREQVTIPTYRACQPETAPLFLENRAYRAAQERCIPFLLQKKFAMKRRTWNTRRYSWKTSICR